MNEPYRVLEDRLREELVEEIGLSRCRLWFRDTRLRGIDPDSVRLAVPNEVYRAWVDHVYGDLLQRAVDRVVGGGRKVRLEVSRQEGLRREVRDRLPTSPQAWEALLERRRPLPTLDSYVGDGGDRLPVMLLRQFVHGNGAVDPPAIYLYGEEGTGKTHMLEALHREAEAQSPGRSVYLTSRRFTTLYVSALRSKDLGALRAFEVDFEHRRLVLLDDVHLLAGRKATQQALVRLRERAVGSPVRFVFGSRRHPQELDRFSGRLRSWLMGGVVLRVARPDDERLQRILEARARSYGLGSLPGEVLDGIREQTGSMHGAVEILDRWAAASAELGRPLDAGWLGEVAPAVSVTPRVEVIRRAKRVVSDYFNLPPSLLDCPTKARRAALPRRMAMYLVYRATALPLAEIGLAFGLRSHSSVSRAIHWMRSARNEDPALEQTLDGLLARM